ncbi:hypothetical protein Y032_0016g2945 [Ancylostoma ceylanicum]|uniref:SXP/RAL-2 family protein Ani s 5-like cation-binding domain-containing protein n=1 Tax=Ancylostoma ceylanicum TaxID=53326 RepID=A0A016V522_9BILA|nr:hypothetical protein Y032_0016g2945 [Ancylostoma ceylanicum]
MPGMKILSLLFCVSLALARYPYDYNNGYTNNNPYGNDYGNNNYGNNNFGNNNNDYGNNYGNNNGKPYGNSYEPSVPYVLPLTFLRKVSREAAMAFRKIGQDRSQSVREVEEQRIKWAMDNRLEKQYKEYADAGEKGVRNFFDATKKLISKLDQLFSKSKNVVEDKSLSYDSMKKAVRKVFSGLTEKQQMIASFIIYTYGLNFFPFLNGTR